MQDREGEDPRHALAFVDLHEGEQSLALRMCLNAKHVELNEQKRYGTC